MAKEKLHQKKKIVNLESNVEKTNAEKNKISNNLLKFSTELTEVKLLCNGLTNSNENNKNKCLDMKFRVITWWLIGQWLTTSLNVKFVTKYLLTGTSEMSISKSSVKNLNNILLRVTNLPGDFARTHALGAEMCFVALNLYIFVCSGFNNNKK